LKKPLAGVEYLMEFFKQRFLMAEGADVLIDSEDVNAVTFAGSVSAGGKVAQRATS